MSLINFFFGIDQVQNKREGGYHPSAEPPQFMIETGNNIKGITVTRKKVEAVATVYNCVIALQKALGVMPIAVFEKGANDILTVNSTHPLHKLLGLKPNGLMNVQSWKEMIVSELCFLGNSFHKIVRSGGGKVSAIVPLEPHLVRVKRTMDNNLVYVYKDKFIFTADEILHFKNVTSDGIMGQSPIDYTRNLFATAIAGENYSVNTLANNATPSGILSVVGKLDKDQAKRLRDDWNELYGRGEETGNVGGTAVLEQGSEWKPISMSPADAEFIQNMKFTQTQICGIFGVPPHMAGNMDGAKYDNLEAQGTNFVRYGLLHLMKRIEIEIDSTLLQAESNKNNFIKFNPDVLMRGATTDRYTAHRVGIEAGFLTRNEARIMENRNPIDGLDNPIQPLNMGIANANEVDKPKTTEPEQEDPETKSLSVEILRPVLDDCIARINSKFDGKARQSHWFGDNERSASERVPFIEQKMRPFISDVLSPLVTVLNLSDTQVRGMVDDIANSLLTRNLK